VESDRVVLGLEDKEDYAGCWDEDEVEGVGRSS